MCSSTPSVRTPRVRRGSLVRRVASRRTACQRVCQSTFRCRASAETVVSSCASASTAHALAREVSTVPRRNQLVRFGPRPDRAVGLGATPDPLEPNDEHRHPETRRVRRGHPAPAMPDCEHPAPGTPGRVGIGLHGDHQLAMTALDVEHMHAVGVEHRIGAGAPRHARTTPTVIHVGVFDSSGSFVAPDPEDPDPHISAMPRRTAHPCLVPKSSFEGVGARLAASSMVSLGTARHAAWRR
jgi:hypothetical protein